MTWKITSKFGEQEAFRHRPHTGIDFGMPSGTELRSIHSGEIVKIVDYGNSNLGKGVFVKWQDGKVSIYGHLSEFAKGIKVGDKVQAGDLLGYAGSTGRSTGNHLHFAVKEGERFLDPSPYIDLIQNMDNPTLLAKMSDTIPQPVQIPSDNLFTISNIFKQTNVYSDLLQLFKANLITFLSEVKLNVILTISDYSIFSQYLKYVLQFFS